MNFALAANCYGDRDPWAAKSLMHALLLAERRGFHMTTDLSRFGQHLVLSRNTVHYAALNDDGRNYEGVLWVDSDILMPMDAIARLLGHGKDFITGLYFKRGYDYAPLIAQLFEKEMPDGTTEWWSRHRRMWGPGHGLVTIPDGTCGFGFVYTSIQLLKELAPAADGGKEGPFTKLPQISEPGDDYSFCFRVAMLHRASPVVHTQFWADTDITLEHQGIREKYDVENYFEHIIQTKKWSSKEEEEEPPSEKRL